MNYHGADMKSRGVPLLTDEVLEEVARRRSGEPEQPEYARLAVQIGELVTERQAQYGNSFGHSGDVLRILYPDGIQPDQYDDALAVVRIVDKLFRLANGSQGEESPYRDIAGYGLLGWARQESENAKGK